MSVARYAYVYARIRARLGDMLTDRDLRALVDARKEDFIAALMDTPYKVSLAKENLTEIDAHMIEKAMKQELIHQYLMVIRSTEAALRDFMIELFRRFEVMNMKAIIRAKAGAAGTTESVLLFPVEPLFKDYRSVLATDSVEEAIKHFEEPYRAALEASIPEYRRSNRLLDLENALDRVLFGAIYSSKEHLRRADREIVEKLIGTELDIANILTLLRCKEEGIAVADMERYFMPYSYAFDPDVDAVRDAISADSISSAIQLLPDCPYKSVLSDAIPHYEEQKSLLPFELALRRYSFVWIRKAMFGYPIDIGTVLGYLYLKELEIRNICTIAVCKENELPAEETLKLIISDKM